MELNIKDFVGKAPSGDKNGVAFSHYFDGSLYYNVIPLNIDAVYQFEVPLSDTGGATFKSYDTALYFMRWIRKAINNGTMNRI